MQADEDRAGGEVRAGGFGFLRRTHRVPTVLQVSAEDCAAACLAMVLAYHGRAAGLEKVRETLGARRDGTSAAALLDAARRLGLRGRGVRIEPDQLKHLDPAAILHWDFNHYVVFERSSRSTTVIVDPAAGRRRVPNDEFGRSFTGVALLFEPSAGATAMPAARRRLWRYALDVMGDRRLWTPVLATSLLVQLFALAVPVMTGALVDRVVPFRDYDLLGVLALGALAVVVFEFLSVIVRGNFLVQLRTRIDARLTSSFIEHMFGLPYAYFQSRSAGDLMMRVGSHGVVREIVTSGALSAVLDGLLVGAYLVILFIVHAPMALVAMGLAGLQAAVFLAARQRQRELMSESLLKQAREQSYEFELLSGIETLKAMGGERSVFERWSHLFADVLDVSARRGRFEALVGASFSALNLASPLMLLGYGAWAVLGGALSLGTMLAATALATGFLGPVSTLVLTALQFQLLDSYLSRINDVFDTAPEQVDDPRRRAPRLQGRVSVERVTFRYGPDAPAAVGDASFEAEAGMRVAIVGRSGAGKTTLAELLLGLYRPESGRILFDGHDASAVDLPSLRRQIGSVTQFPYLFGSTVRSNIALVRPDATLDDVVRAAERALIHDDIAALPMGYDTFLSDGGSSLSGGQRQRIALARAILNRPRILILDEATSALDAETEARVMESLKSLGATLVTVAHRLSTVASADRILVMEGGRIVEQGTHRDLTDRCGVYADLVRAQVSAGGEDR